MRFIDYPSSERDVLGALLVLIDKKYDAIVKYVSK